MTNTNPPMTNEKKKPKTVFPFIKGHVFHANFEFCKKYEYRQKRRAQVSLTLLKYYVFGSSLSLCNFFTWIDKHSMLWAIIINPNTIQKVMSPLNSPAIANIILTINHICILLSYKYLNSSTEQSSALAILSTV